MSIAASITPELCPLCGKANQCAMEVQRLTGEKQPPCWCTRVTFDAALLASLPPESRGVACVCAACAALSSTGARPASP